MTFPVHLQESYPATHFFQAPIGFSPVNFLTEGPGDGGTVDTVSTQTYNQVNLCIGEFPSAVSHTNKYREKDCLCSAIIAEVSTGQEQNRDYRSTEGFEVYVLQEGTGDLPSATI
jgi:hypothetical protein